MTVFLEDPKPAIFIGIVALAVLASLLPRTRRYGLVLLAMGGVLVLVGAGVVVERLVVTDREKVEATLNGIAAALENNDVEGVLEYLSPSAGSTRDRAEWALEQVVVTDTGFHHLDITFNQLTSPPSAEARFDGTIRYRFRAADVGRGFYAAKFVVELRLEDGRWLVTDHIEQTPLRL